ncbi:class I SAM-dependent DNA methyltransferase [Candidatus Viridilinea mediisalina]|uniref:Methyltransferase type 11 n=1 Tax=Candidatus Viridilinea mediisalina TaxID=2024553 RepID=A0A2A6RHF1_9CHLR|nr:class I SAM-dependent methyltransferase [Candidatus Viridilinea mediisalina]PDW02442.1 methyltransferase type 11 [Candidatus Viridilinea mediisalina]
MDTTPTPHATRPYEQYAAVYDASGQVRFALLFAIYVQELLDRHPLEGRRALDLACGTGTLALLLAQTGWTVTGLDRSAAMLAQARAKLPADGSVRLVHADMRCPGALLPTNAFDLATCTYDSLNYMTTPDDLMACFRVAAAALAPGGLYLADMNTRYFLEEVWGECVVCEQDGYVQLERSQFIAATARSVLHLTGFVGDDTHGYTRFDEHHVERAYPPEQVTTLLARAGLMVEATYDGFSLNPPGPQTERIFWVARKPR